jgi:O-antigen/teichoic acid export membrane protein
MAEESLKNKTKKGLYWKFAEQFSNYGIQFLIGIVMARLLSPSDYGITALPAVFIAIAGVFTSAGFSDALVRKPELKEDDLSTTFFYSLGVGLLCYIILFYASPWIANFYNTPVLKSLMRVTALTFLITPIGIPQNVLLKRKIDFKTPAKISVVVKILSGIVGISLAYYGYGVWALVLSELFSTVSVLVITLSVVRWYPKTGWSKESFSYLWGFGNKLMVSSLLDTVYKNITPIIVGKYFSTADLGVYNRARQYAALPSQQIHSVVREVSFPVLSKLQNDKERLIDQYRKMISVSAFVIFPLMMLMSALARPLIITLITAKWEECVVLLQLLCFSMMWYPVHALNLNILMICGRTDLCLRLEIIKKIWGLLVLCCSLPFGLVAFCSAGIASSIVSVYINTWYTGKIWGFGFKEQMKDLLPIIALGFLMFGSVLGVTYLLNNMLLQLIFGAITGAIIYIGGAIFLKFQEFNEVKYLLSRK